MVYVLAFSLAALHASMYKPQQREGIIRSSSKGRTRVEGLAPTRPQLLVAVPDNALPQHPERFEPGCIPKPSQILGALEHLMSDVTPAMTIGRGQVRPSGRSRQPCRPEWCHIMTHEERRMTIY